MTERSNTEQLLATIVDDLQTQSTLIGKLLNLQIEQSERDRFQQLIADVLAERERRDQEHKVPDIAPPTAPPSPDTVTDTAGRMMRQFIKALLAAGGIFAAAVGSIALGSYLLEGETPPIGPTGGAPDLSPTDSKGTTNSRAPTVERRFTEPAIKDQSIAKGVAATSFAPTISPIRRADTVNDARPPTQPAIRPDKRGENRPTTRPPVSVPHTNKDARVLIDLAAAPTNTQSVVNIASSPVNNQMTTEQIRSAMINVAIPQLLSTVNNRTSVTASPTNLSIDRSSYQDNSVTSLFASVARSAGAADHVTAPTTVNALAKIMPTIISNVAGGARTTVNNVSQLIDNTVKQIATINRTPPNQMSIDQRSGSIHIDNRRSLFSLDAAPTQTASRFAATVDRRKVAVVRASVHNDVQVGGNQINNVSENVIVINEPDPAGVLDRVNGMPM